MLWGTVLQRAAERNGAMVPSSLAAIASLVERKPEPFRALAAPREGAGVEISTALTVRPGGRGLR